jgi:hypothetical protein
VAKVGGRSFGNLQNLIVNKGTEEGDRAEENFVVNFNNGRYAKFVDSYYSDVKNLLAVRVTSHQFSFVSKGLVKPKADAFLISADDSELGGRTGVARLLTEGDLSNFPHKVIPDSGISVKRPDSTKYQIHKFTRASFLTVFGDPILGAGALVYTDNASKINENKEILEGWGLSLGEFSTSISERMRMTISQNVHDYKSVQKFCLAEIKRQILEDSDKLDVVFWGRTTFQSPYFAQYSYIGGVLGPAKAVDFIVTQGSNRLNDPTIVVKPR